MPNAPKNYVKIMVVLITRLMHAKDQFQMDINLLANKMYIQKDYHFCDKFDCMPYIVNDMNRYFNLRRQFIGGCICQNKAHTDTSRPKSSKSPKLRNESLLPNSANSNASSGDMKTSHKYDHMHVIGYNRTVSNTLGHKFD